MIRFHCFFSKTLCLRLSRALPPSTLLVPFSHRSLVQRIISLPLSTASTGGLKGTSSFLDSVHSLNFLHFWITVLDQLSSSAAAFSSLFGSNYSSIRPLIIRLSKEFRFESVQEIDLIVLYWFMVSVCITWLISIWD